MRVGVTWRKPLLTKAISVNDIDGFAEFGEFEELRLISRPYETAIKFPAKL